MALLSNIRVIITIGTDFWKAPSVGAHTAYSPFLISLPLHHSPFLHLSLLPISSYILSSSPATAKESGERLNVASESGRKPAAKRHLVHLGLKEVLLLREC